MVVVVVRGTVVVVVVVVVVEMVLVVVETGLEPVVKVYVDPLVKAKESRTGHGSVEPPQYLSRNV